MGKKTTRADGCARDLCELPRGQSQHARVDAVKGCQGVLVLQNRSRFVTECQVYHYFNATGLTKQLLLLLLLRPPDSFLPRHPMP